MLAIRHIEAQYKGAQGAQDAQNEKIVRFIAELKPNRSINQRNLLNIGLIIFSVSFAISILFLTIGAWPVSGFFGLDALLLYAALYTHANAPLATEIIEINPRELIIKHKPKYGKQREWRFPPQWVQIILEKDPQRKIIGNLLIKSHGRTIKIGDFLSPEEKQECTNHIKKELGRIKNP